MKKAAKKKAAKKKPARKKASKKKAVKKKVDDAASPPARIASSVSQSCGFLVFHCVPAVEALHCWRRSSVP